MLCLHQLKVLLLVEDMVQGLHLGWRAGSDTQTPSGRDNTKAKQEASQSSPIAGSKQIMGELEVVGQVLG